MMSPSELIRCLPPEASRVYLARRPGRALYAGLAAGWLRTLVGAPVEDVARREADPPPGACALMRDAHLVLVYVVAEDVGTAWLDAQLRAAREAGRPAVLLVADHPATGAVRAARPDLPLVAFDALRRAAAAATAHIPQPPRVKCEYLGGPPRLDTVPLLVRFPRDRERVRQEWIARYCASHGLDP